LSSEIFDIPVRNQDIEIKLERRRQLILQKELTEDEKNELKQLNAFAHSLPFAETPVDIESREIIRQAAEYLKNHGHSG
jgi:hypothetical protein